MSRAHTALVAVLLVFAVPSVLAPAQDPAATPASASVSAAKPQVIFAFERVGLPVPKYKLTIQEDGTTVYDGDELPQVSGYGASAASPAHPFRSVVRISPGTAEHIFAMGRKLNHFNIMCASKAKNIADTGTKILSYSAPDGSGTCTYNFTENRDIASLTETFLGITETMDRGRELDHLHRFDRLGLDAAISFLAQEVSEGHALELGTIAVSLRSIAGDPEVIERVRTRANKLLALIPGEVQQAGP